MGESTNSTTNFLASSSILIVANVVAQFLLIAFLPWLARIYTPEDFGLLAIFHSTSAILGAIACGCLHQAIPLSKTKNTGILLVYICILLSILFGVCFFPIAWLVITNLNITYEYNSWLVALLLVSAIFLISTSKTLFDYLIRNDSYLIIAIARISQNIVTIFFQLFFSFFTTIGLLLGYTLGFLSTVIVFSIGSKINPIQPKYSSKHILATVSRYSDFPKFTTFTVLVNNLSAQVPILLSSTLYGTPIAGQFAMAERLAAAPLTLISVSVGQAYFGYASRIDNNKELAKFFKEIHLLLVLIASPFFLFLALNSSWIVDLLLGDQWILASEIITIMCSFLLLGFIVSPLTYTFKILGEQKNELVIQVCVMLARVSAFYLGYILGGILLAVSLFASASCIYYLYVVFWLGNRLDIQPWTLVKHYILSSIVALLINLPVLIGTSLSTTRIPFDRIFISGIGIFVLSYLLLTGVIVRLFLQKEKAN